jgi:hypothetical protein
MILSLNNPARMLSFIIGWHSGETGYGSETVINFGRAAEIMPKQMRMILAVVLACFCEGLSCFR